MDCTTNQNRRKPKKGRLLLSCICLACLLAGCSFSSAPSERSQDGQSAQTQPDPPLAGQQENPSSPKEVPAREPQTSNYFYRALSLEQKQVYGELLAGLQDCASSIEFSAPVDEASFEKVLDILTHQEVDLIHLARGESLGTHYSTQEGQIVRFEPSYSMDADTYAAQLEAIEQVRDAVVQECENRTPYEAVAYVNDYLASHCVYDGEQPQSHTLAGALLDGKAVCEGYSAAFKYLLSACGLDCMILIGQAANTPDSQERVAHSWNAVYIEDGWYYCDPTWNDTNLDPDSLGRHFFLNTTYQEIMKERDDVWTREHMGNYPQENNRTYSPYMVEQTYFGSQQELLDALDGFAQEAEPALLSVRFVQAQDYEWAKENFAQLFMERLPDGMHVDWSDSPYLSRDDTHCIDWYVVRSF